MALCPRLFELFLPLCFFLCEVDFFAGEDALFASVLPEFDFVVEAPGATAGEISRIAQQNATKSIRIGESVCIQNRTGETGLHMFPESGMKVQSRRWISALRKCTGQENRSV